MSVRGEHVLACAGLFVERAVVERQEDRPLAWRNFGLGPRGDGPLRPGKTKGD